MCMIGLAYKIVPAFGLSSWTSMQAVADVAYSGRKELMFSLACKAAIVQVTFWHSSLPVMWEIATGWRR